MKRVALRSKDVNKLIEGYSFEVSKKDKCFMVDDRVLIINDVPSFFYHENKLVPTLKFLQSHDILKKIVVDIGALKFVTNGADIMRPGITKIDPSIVKGEAILVVDETHGKPIAVGIALLSGEEMSSSEGGKVIQNIHYVGDELWNM